MWPAIIGGAMAVGGGVANYLNGRDNAQKLQDAYDDISGQTKAAVAANQADIDAYKALIANTYGDGNKAYQDRLNAFLKSPVYQNENFAYVDENGNPITVEQFMDPAANQRVDAAMSAINNSAASGGNRFSSDYVDRVGAKQQALASEEWAKSYERLMQDRQQAMAEYTTNSQNKWNNYNANVDKAKYGIDAAGADRSAYTQGMGDVTTASMNNRLGGLNTQAQTIMGSANAGQNTSGWALAGDILGAGGKFLSSYFGGK